MTSTDAPGAADAPTAPPPGDEAKPPSTLPDVPGIEGMSEEEVRAFLESLDEFTPTIPDGLTNHYLKLSGIKEPDVRITRLISLAAQSFVAQIAADAHQCATRRVEMQAREKRERGYDPKDKRIVMTMEDVSAALGERGVDVRKPQYFEGSADEPEPGESGKEGAAAKKRR